MEKVKNIKPVKIEYRYDETNSMESLYVNGECIGTGNDWDYHLSDGREAIQSALDVLKIPYVSVVKQGIHTDNGEWKRLKVVE